MSLAHEALSSVAIPCCPLVGPWQDLKLAGSFNTTRLILQKPQPSLDALRPCDEHIFVFQCRQIHRYVEINLPGFVGCGDCARAVLRDSFIHNSVEWKPGICSCSKSGAAMANNT